MHISLRAFIGFFCLSHSVAYADDTRSIHQGFQSGPYIGASVNYEHMNGHRSDGLRTALGNSALYVNDGRISDDAIGFDVYMGYLYRMPETNIVLGIEPFVAIKGNDDTSSGFIEDFRQEAKIKRKCSAGLLLRCGYVIADNWLVYGIVGPDWGRFTYHQNELTEDTSSPTLTSSKWLKGIRYGLGIEKEFEYFRLGIQATMTNYRTAMLSATDEFGDSLFGHFRSEVFTLGVRLSIPF